MRNLKASVTELLKYSVPALAVAGLRRSPKSVSSASNRQPPRILVVKIDAMGDFILSTPFFRELRRNYRDSKITLVVGDNVSELALPCPYVDAVLPLRLRRQTPLTRHLKYVMNFADQHLSGQFDLAIQPRWDIDTDWATLTAFLSKAERIIGFTEKTSGMKSRANFGYNGLFTETLPPGPERHESDRALDILRYLGGSISSRSPELWLLPEDQRQADNFLQEKKLLNVKQSLIAFGIGASSARRQWPFYARLMRTLSGSFPFAPMLLAGPGEAELVRGIAAEIPNAVVVQQLPLRVVSAILSRCNLFIGNDSGPMHLASAVGLPVIEISCHPLDGDPGHANSPGRFGPLVSPSVVIQPKTFSGDCRGGCKQYVPHCIATISPEDVASAAIKLMRGTHERELSQPALA